MSDLPLVRLREVLREYLLHPTIRRECLPVFEAGQYQAAVFEAFRMVEVAVHDGAGASKGAHGRSMIQVALHTEKGPLRDPDATGGEGEYLRDLMAGGVPYFKNPRNHRNVDVTDPNEAAQMLIIASHLLSIVEKRSADAKAGARRRKPKGASSKWVLQLVALPCFELGDATSSAVKADTYLGAGHKVSAAQTGAASGSSFGYVLLAIVAFFVARSLYRRWQRRRTERSWMAAARAAIAEGDEAKRRGDAPTTVTPPQPVASLASIEPPRPWYPPTNLNALCSEAMALAERFPEIAFIRAAALGAELQPTRNNVEHLKRCLVNIREYAAKHDAETAWFQSPEGLAHLAEQRRQEEAERLSEELRASEDFGFVYLLDAGEGLYKIGKTRRDPVLRAEEWELTILAHCETANCDDAERALHDFFAEHRVGSYELFRVDRAVVETEMQRRFGEITRHR